MPSPFDLAQSLLNQDDAPGDQTSGVSPWHAAQAALADEPASAPAQPAASPTWNAAKVASDTFDIGYRGPTSAEIALHDKFADPEFAATAEAQYERDTKRAAQAKQNAILKSEGVGRFADAAQTKARLEKSWLGKVPIVGDALVSGATGVASGLMDLGSTATNLVGADEVSKDLRTRSQTANAADAARYEPDSVTGWLAARTRNLGNAAPKMALGGGTGGGAAIFGLDGATDAAQAADDAGVTGASKYTYVASVGAMNALQSVIFGKLFAGAKSVPKAELMSALKSHGAEILKGTMGNFAVGTVDHLAARLAGVDKTEWTPEELVHDGVNALGDAGAIHGAGMAARAADLARTSPNAAEAILAGEPSRSTFEQAGLGDIKSKPDREAFQNALREVQPSERQQRISENIATHAKPTESMTPEDMKKALLTHPLTGIPNGRAYSEAPKKPIQVQMDIEGLKYFNDNVGKVLGVGDTAGDEVLRAAARAIHDEVDDSYNTHGDTFIAQFDTHEEKAAAMAAAEERLRDAEVDVHMPDGSVKTFKGIGVAWGEGDTLDKAHGDMEADKVRRVDSGKRAPRGEAPRSLVEVPAQGGENSSGQTPTAQEAPAQPGGESPEARSSAAASASPEGVAGHAELNARAKELGLAVGGLSKSAKQERIDTVEHFGSGLPLPSEVHDISRGALRQAVDFMLGRGGESAPLTTKGDRAAGESVAAHAASKGAAKPIADSMYSRIMGEAAGSDKAAHDIGALLSEDQLRDLRGKSDKPESVKTLVGKDGYFETEADFQKVKREYAPQLAAAKKILNTFMDKNYRLTQDLDPETELPTRGKETGVRINLMAVRPEEAAAAPGGPGGDLNAPRRNYNVFSKKATGAAEHGYETDFRKIIENTVNRTYEKATRVDMFNKLVAGGLAQWGEKGAPPPQEIGGEKAVRIDTNIANQNKALYLKESLAREVRQAMDTDMAASRTKVGDLINKIQIAGVGPISADFAYHTANDIAAVMSAPGGKTALGNMLRVPGANFVDAIARIGKAAYDNARGKNVERLAEMAARGSLRTGSDDAAGFSSKLLEGIDRATRVALDKMYDDLVARGVKEDTETSRREFVNQAGQYNARLQTEWMARLKQSGIAPFVTAGKTFNRTGRQALTGGSAGESTSKAAGAQLRAEQIIKNIIAPVTIAGAINFLSGAKGQNLPLGAIDLHKKDENGNEQYLDLLKWTLVRRGMNATGLGAVEEGLRNNRAPGTVADQALKGIVNASIHPFIGPLPHFAYTAVMGKEPALGAPSAPDAGPGKSQIPTNLKYAAEKLNPMLASAGENLINNMSRVTTGKTVTNPDRGTVAIATDTFKGALGLKSEKKPTSRAIDLAHEMLQRRQPSGDAATQEDRDTQAMRATLTRAIREGKDPQQAMNEAIASGDVTEKQAWLSAKAAKLDAKSALFKSLDLTEAKKVLDVATPDEKDTWAQLYQDKIGAKAKALARAKPLSGDRDHPLADKIAQWHAEVSDAKRMLDEAGIPAQDVVAAYRKAMKGKDVGYGLVNLRRQLVASR